MSARAFRVKTGNLTPCGKCGQSTDFLCKSAKVAEDGCEVWIECICGFDPHKFNERLESVMGGCGKDNIRMAIGCWNDAAGNKSNPPTL